MKNFKEFLNEILLFKDDVWFYTQKEENDEQYIYLGKNISKNKFIQRIKDNSKYELKEEEISKNSNYLNFFFLFHDSNFIKYRKNDKKVFVVDKK